MRPADCSVGPHSTQLVGTVETFRDGQPTKSGTAFMDGFGPATKSSTATTEE